MCEQAFAVQLKVQEFLHDLKLSAVFVPNGRWAKGPGAIVVRVILAGLTPPCFRDDVHRRVHFKGASRDPYRLVQSRGGDVAEELGGSRRISAWC